MASSSSSSLRRDHQRSFQRNMEFVFIYLLFCFIFVLTWVGYVPLLIIPTEALSPVAAWRRYLRPPEAPPASPRWSHRPPRAHTDPPKVASQEAVYHSIRTMPPYICVNWGFKSGQTQKWYQDLNLEVKSRIAVTVREFFLEKQVILVRLFFFPVQANILFWTKKISLTIM